MSNYKSCSVPQCKTTTIKTPDKLFITVPKSNLGMRRNWLQLAGRNLDNTSENSTIYFCEDHFDLETDMENYMQYKMGFSKYVKLKNGVLPTKFHCHGCIKRKILCSTVTSTQPKQVKGQNISTSTAEDCDENIENIPPKTNNQNINMESYKTCDKAVSTVPIQTDTKSTEFSVQTSEKAIQTSKPIKTASKATQYCYQKHIRSKATQTKFPSRETGVSPMRHSTGSISTHSFNVAEDSYECKPSRYGFVSSGKSIGSEIQSKKSSVSLSTQISSSDDNDSVNEHNIKILSAQNTLRLISANPIFYIGIPEESYYLLDNIHKHTKIPHEHLMLCLKKIRLNSSFTELADEFGISISYASKLFLKNVPIIASILRPFIVKLDTHSIKKTLPVSFRHNYYNVSCIIDCLEIDIQKPSKALFQALTWSDYKKGNTIKFLISCTPNGLVNYISPGFGGRASDITIIENCDFLDNLEPSTFILADRGFKHIEPILNRRGIKLLRPPSVMSGLKLSKAEVRQTKIIASLRIHVERVIRRLIEFDMLKQHATINKNFLRLTNDVIVIACALVNIQDSLIK